MSRLSRTAGRVTLAVGVATAALAAAVVPGTVQASPTVPAPPRPTLPVPPRPTLPTPPRPTLPTPTIALVLAPYVGGFDNNNNNFNIATHVLLQFPDLALATAKPGNTTVFLPTDYAFRALVKSLTGRVVVPEAKVFQAIHKLGLTRLGAILRTHVVKGIRLTYAQLLRSHGKVLTTWHGSKITVEVRQAPRRAVVLHDGAPALPDAKIINANVMASNGIIHIIDRVMLPSNR